MAHPVPVKEIEPLTHLHKKVEEILDYLGESGIGGLNDADFLDGEPSSFYQNTLASTIILAEYTVPSTVDRIYLRGYTTANDGGAAWYKRVEDEPAHAGKVQSADGAWWEIVLLNGQVNVKQFGAKGDGTTDDQAAINNADAALSVISGGGVVLYPPGVYVVDFNELSGIQRAGIVVSDNVIHRGAGKSKTTVKIKDAADSHGFVLRGLTGSGVESMTINGNRANQPGTPASGNQSAGILVADNATRMILRDLRVIQTFDYAIGVEVGDAVDCILQDIDIEDAGADGIDFKSTTGGNRGNILHNIRIKRHGLQTGTGEIFAGIDVRGVTMLSNISVTQFGNSRTGIRLHVGEGGEGTIGAHRSQLTNFEILAASGVHTDSIGLHSRAHDCQISNGFIANTYFGIVSAQRECVYSNLTIHDAVRGWKLENDETSGGDPLLTNPDQNIFSGIIVRGCTQYGLDIESNNNTFQGVIARGNDQNVILRGTAANNRFIGGQIAAPTGATNLTDNGTDTIFRNVQGVVTEARVLSDQFAVDSTGTKTVTIAHGLSFSPKAGDCAVTLVRSTPVADYTINYLRILSADANNVTVEVFVGVASATGGAVARLALTAATRV